MQRRIANAVAGFAARVSSLLGPGGMRVLARFNKYVTNPLQRLWAPYLPFYAVIEHTGRKSGASYRTPVMAFVENGTLTVLLNYGAGSDWVRNIQAADFAGVVHRRRHYRLEAVRVVTADSPGLPAGIRRTADASERTALHGRLTATG